MATARFVEPPHFDADGVVLREGVRGYSKCPRYASMTICRLRQSRRKTATYARNVATAHFPGQPHFDADGVVLREGVRGYSERKTAPYAQNVAVPYAQDMVPGLLSSMMMF